MPVARCLSRLDDKPIALAWNGDAVPRGPVSVAGRDSCRRSAYLGQIAILLRPRPVSENRQPCQRIARTSTLVIEKSSLSLIKKTSFPKIITVKSYFFKIRFQKKNKTIQKL